MPFWTSKKAQQNVRTSSMLQLNPSHSHSQWGSTNYKRSLICYLLQISITFIFVHNLFITQTFAHSTSSFYNSTNTTDLSTQHQTFPRLKRFSFFGIDEEKAANYCQNGGKLLNGKCDCKFPFTGIHCTDFECQNGLSTGPRYDPDSPFFNKKCICDKDWSGEWCHIPIANQCNERGQYVNGRCICQGFYFGPKCEYVGKCVHGKLVSGICNCVYGYEGDYCTSIVCHHGYQNKATNLTTCICPDRHTGQFCDECLNQDENIQPFPNCSRIIKHSKAKLSRAKTDQLIIYRLLIIAIVFSVLMILMAIIYARKWGSKRSGKSHYEIELEETMSERQQILKDAVFAQNGNNKFRRGSKYVDPNRMDNDLLGFAESCIE